MVAKYPNRILVYGLEGDCPLFFDADGRGSEIFPTGIEKLMSYMDCVVYLYMRITAVRVVYLCFPILVN